MRPRWLGALAALAMPAAAAAQAPPDATPQTLFAGAILADPRTTNAVAALLRADAADIASRPVFGDLTGDRDDAVVTVHRAGAAGFVAVYVLSADGTRRGRLRVVMRSQSLYRAPVELDGMRLTILVPGTRPETTSAARRRARSATTAGTTGAGACCTTRRVSFG